MFNKNTFAAQFSNKGIHHLNLTKIYEIFRTVVFWTAESTEVYCKSSRSLSELIDCKVSK